MAIVTSTVTFRTPISAASTNWACLQWSMWKLSIWLPTTVSLALFSTLRYVRSIVTLANYFLPTGGSIVFILRPFVQMASLSWSARSQSPDGQLAKLSWTTWQTLCSVTRWRYLANLTSHQTAGSSWLSIVKRLASRSLSSTPRVNVYTHDCMRELRNVISFLVFLVLFDGCRRRAEICLWRANNFEC